MRRNVALLALVVLAAACGSANQSAHKSVRVADRHGSSDVPNAVASNSAVSHMPPGCVQYPEASRVYLSPSGQHSPVPHRGWAIIVHFTDGSQQLLLPTGFNPGHASDRTLY